MSKSDSKSRILYIYRTLVEETDSEHQITIQQIIDKLEEIGISAYRKTVQADIDFFKEFGLDVVCIRSSQNRYYMNSNIFTLSELKLLVDAVEASHFITHSKSAELIGKEVFDLIKELEAKGYGINRGKYLAIKVKPNRKAIRSFRLGDGYSLEHLEYRIANKNLEMPLSEALKYEGIQREYALCIRQIQIELYRKPEADRIYLATYREVVRSSELLFFLQENDIHSADDFKKAVADAGKALADLKNEKNELLKKIAEEEKLIEGIPKYLEVLSRKPLLVKDIKELAKYNYIKDAGVKTADDISVHQEKIVEMKRQLGGMKEKISLAFEKRKEIYDFYDFYESRMKSDYEILLEQAKEEMERIRVAEEKERAEQEKEMSENDRGSFGRGAVR